ncbi:hypothetical protein T265_11664 [Opisthorchis viverrini]|uniref:Uncharacterized protein n=2 Tax=Opisthorchis viverrini TaxID=6198 RepID=A0A074Z279_OPIVI|nr:hypothetical protein T265_11664 [Opisthorchis viverrini]KER19607.1 hypothetical protein T265_11664 [Opisthorchis viverrini]
MPSKVTKWLAAFKPSSPEAVEELATWMYSNVKLLEDLEETFEKLSSSLVSEICQRLYVFYKAKSVSLQRFTIFLLPSLMHAYLSHLGDEDSSSGRKGSASPPESQQSSIMTNLTSLESCLIGISRHYILINSQNPKLSSSRPEPGTSLPLFTGPSIFHDSLPNSESPSSDNDTFPSFTVPLARFSESSLAYLIQDYLDTLSSVDLLDSMSTLLSLHSMTRFCAVCDRVASLSRRPRIIAGPGLLSDFLVGLDTILYKLDDLDRRTDSVRRTSLTIRTAVWDAIKQIEKRAAFNCLSAPLLICRAILHGRGAQYGPRAVPGMRLGAGSSAFVDIGVLLASADDRGALNGPVASANLDHSRPLRPHPSTGLEVITNASFRPESLPEDIPISNHPPKQKSSADPDQNTNASTKKSRAEVSTNGKPNATDSRQRTGTQKQSKGGVNFISPTAPTKKTTSE